MTFACLPYIDPESTVAIGGFLRGIRARLVYSVGMTSLPAKLMALAVLTVAATAQVRVIPGGSEVSGSQLKAVAALAREGMSRLSRLFPGTPSREVRIVVHVDADSIPPALRRSLHPGVPGFALLQRDEIHLVFADIRIDPPNDLRTTVDHELVHILLDQFVGKNGHFVARWFHEGLAQDLAGGGYLGVQEEDLVLRVRARSYIPFPELEEGFPKDNPDRLALAYGQSYSFVSFLRREVGLQKLLTTVKECGPKKTFSTVFSASMKQPLFVYEDEWLEYISNESGAGFRVILRNCFLILVLALAGPLLALAVARRRNREERMKKRLGEQDRAEDVALDLAEAERARIEAEGTAEDGWNPDGHMDGEDADHEETGFEEEDDDDDEDDADEVDEDDADEVDWDDWKTDPTDPGRNPDER